MGYNSTEKKSANQRDYREKKREWARSQLGGKCARCGATENLEFDHINRSTKIDHIANLVVNGTMQELIDEINKCQLLCSSCHRIKSIEFGDTTETKHGTYQMRIRKGCKCELCVTYMREYNREAMRRWRASRRVKIA